jgi:hypothetical protein
MRDGQALTRAGGFVDTKHPKAHIPPEEYNYVSPTRIKK